MTAKKKTNGATVQVTLYQQILTSSLLGSQTAAKLKAIFGRDMAEDDILTLYSVRRKMRTTPEQVQPFERHFAGKKAVDIEAIQALPESKTTPVLLDSGEARMLQCFLAGWLKAEGSLADRDWAMPLIESC